MKHKYQVYKTILQSISNKGFFHLLYANLLIIIVSFGSQFFVAWLLTPEQLGEIKIMQTYLGIALLFSTFGFTTSTLKLCSENRTEGEKLYLYKKATNYVFVSLLITLILLFLLTKNGLISNDIEIIKYFPYFSLVLIPWTFAAIHSNYLQATKQIKILSQVQLFTKLLSVGLIIALTFIFGFNGYIIALVFGYFATTYFLKYKVDRLNRPIKEIKISNPFQIHLRYSNISLITNLVGQIALYADVFLMNYFVADKVAVGYYSFALTLTLMTYIFTSTVQQMAVPYLSEKSSNKNEFKLASNKYEKINIISSIIIAIILLISIPLLVKLVFGSKYLPSIPFFIVLILAWLFQNVVSFKGYSLLGAGKIGYNLISSVILLFVGFSVSYILMMKFGIIGLAYGKLITNFFSIFVVIIVSKIGMKSF